jgi:hypothetical protein
MLDLTSGYITRAAGRLPRQGARQPWRLRQNYLLDLLAARFGNLGSQLEFSGRLSSPGGGPYRRTVLHAVWGRGPRAAAVASDRSA